MLSWRVAILPFIEQKQLYDQFRWDEPWDSDHNIKLLDEMPAVYSHPDKPTQAGYTVYQAPLSDKSLLRRNEPASFADVRDGLSNTIMLLETSSDVAVPWTAPQDYDIDEEQPGANLFANGITQVLLGDGSVHVVAESIADELLNALYTRDGGERVAFP
jgi:hypothetical protein